MNSCICKKLCAFAVLFLLIIQTDLSAQIQVYPVSVTTQLTPPYSVNLADYAAPGCEQLKVIIVQRDLTQAPYMLYLKMQIELNGRVIIRTSPPYIPPPLTLEPGLPTIISGTDLYPFFDPQNMDFVGYSRETYMDTRLLPEGAYIITFTAYDYVRREVALSSGGSMFCYLAKTDPPLLNFPFNNSALPSSPSQFINFQWLSRTTSSPNSAQSTRYRFDLFEIRLDGRSPAEIVQSMRPLFTAETDRTSLAYSIADPTLESGLRYAWRVRAFDTEGRDYIRNNGYSEVFSFVYGAAENTVFSTENIENFVAAAISPRAAKLTWDASSDYDSYKVLYRKEGGEVLWYEEETVQSNFELNGLSPGNIYECKVQGKKNSVWGGFSESDTVLLPMPEVIVCGSEFNRNPVSNRFPLLELMKMQEIDAGGFIVTVIEAISEGSPGRFSGKGFVQVPLFANKKIRCEFINILINTDYQLADGTIHLITDNRDGGENAIWDVDEVFEGGTDNGSVRTGTDGVSVFLTDAVISDPGAILLDTAAKEIVVVNSYGELIHTDISDQLEDKPKSLTVKDSEGDLYSVNTQTGKATFLGKAPAEGAQQQVPFPSVMSSGKGSVTFEAIQEKTKYAFDRRNPKYIKSSLFTEEYKTVKMEDGSLYDIPFKLIPVGETDVVIAKAVLKDKSLKPDSIIFQSGTGTIYSAIYNGTKEEFILTLPSGKDNDGIDVYAMYPNKGGQPYLLGKLTVMSYSWKRPKVVIVPVNGNTIDKGKVKAALDEVYLPVAVDWQVSTDTSKFEASGDSLDVTGSGLFSQYTPGMKKLNNAFIIHIGQAYDPAALYLFVLEKSDDRNLTGDMPRSKQFGYLFTGALGHGKAADEAISRTIAHELAHGIFHLNHTFDTQYQIPKASTKNLMDYTDGTDLVKHQWDAIHDPGIVIGMFERDEEGASFWSGKLTILDTKHTLLFNHVYENNHEGNLRYLNKIQNSRKISPTETSLDLDYSETSEKSWVDSWKLRTATSDEILGNIIKKIQNAENGKKIERMSLNDKGIYIGKFKLEDVEFPIAIYSEKASIDNITKIQVSEISDLDKEENKKHLRSEETFIKYLLIAFYEEDNTEPVLMMQIEKFDFSKDINTKEKWLKYLNILESKKDSLTKFSITEDELKKVFPGNSDERISQVVEVINNYSADFAINNNVRMAHFLGQIGAETGGLKKLKEGTAYTAENVYTVFLKPNLRINDKSSSGKTFRFCDLVEGYDCIDLNNCPNNSNGPSDCTSAINVRLENGRCDWNYEEFDKDYNIKSEYVKSSALFDYVYACRMGNGAKSTKDGSTYLGKGFIHLTGKGQYKKISDEWNKLYPNDQKEFDGKDINLLETDVEIAMKASMIYWKLNNLNDLADDGMDEDNIQAVGAKVNGANPPNGASLRKQFSESAYKNFK
jgi:predicted chitinase